MAMSSRTFTSCSFPSEMRIKVGYCRAGPAGCASSRRPCASGISPTEKVPGTGRWWSSPKHTGSGRGPRRAARRRRAGARFLLRHGQTRRRCASRVFRWRRPECCAPPCRETPGDRVSRSRIGGRLRCPAGSRGKSVARRPSPSTDPSKKASSAEDDRRNGPRISETPGEGDGRSTLRKRTGRCASLIVEKRGRGAPAQFSAARSSNRFPLKFPPRHWIERVCWPPQSTLPDTSGFLGFRVEGNQLQVPLVCVVQFLLVKQQRGDGGDGQLVLGVLGQDLLKLIVGRRGHLHVLRRFRAWNVLLHVGKRQI